MGWVEIGWIGSGWVGSGWVGLGSVGFGWNMMALDSKGRVRWVGLSGPYGRGEGIGLFWSGLCLFGMKRVGLGWLGLGSILVEMS